MTVADILEGRESRVISTNPDTDALAVAGTLRQEGVGAAVVTSAHGELLGEIVSERDILHAIVEHGAQALHLPACDLMTSVVVTCTPETDTAELMQKMQSSKIRHLPVLQDNNLLGVISIRDVMEHVVVELGWAKQTLEQQIIKSVAWSTDED